jgi:acetaldehyde dehydrogenase (acetylating)
VEEVISPRRGLLNTRIVGQSAKKIADMAGIQVPENCKVLLAEEDRIGKDIPFSIEKLSPILALNEVNGWEEARKRCIELLAIGGRGHSLGIHTKSAQVVRDFGSAIPVSRILVNTGTTFGAIGATTGLKPSMTLGCGSFGGNITSDNLAPHHLINIKRVAYRTKDSPKPVNELGTPDIQVQILESLGKQGVTDMADRKTIEEIVRTVLERLK